MQDYIADTLKTAYREGDAEAGELKVYPVIRPKGELEIFGVLVGQFRRYG